MTGFRCWGTRVLLDLFVDDRLEPPQAERVAGHLAACAACRAEADALRPIPALAKAQPPVPPGLVESILREYGAGAAPAPLWRLTPGALAAAAAAALLLLAQAVPGPATQGAPKPSPEAKR